MAIVSKQNSESPTYFRKSNNNSKTVTLEGSLNDDLEDQDCRGAKKIRHKDQFNQTFLSLPS